MRIRQKGHIYSCIYITIQAFELGKKKITTMRIDAELLKKAHDIGLNVSKISENAIREAIKRMEVVRK